jgi:hypothetical protein
MQNAYKQYLNQFQWGDLWFFIALILATILSAMITGLANLNIDSNLVAYVVVGIELAYIFLVIKKRKVRK